MSDRGNQLSDQERSEIRDQAIRAHQKDDEFYRASNEIMVDSGKEAIKAVMLLTGGATVAMLALIGSLLTKEDIVIDKARFFDSLSLFAAGAAASALASALAYLTNFCMTTALFHMPLLWEPPFVGSSKKTEVWLKAKKIFHVLAVVCVVIAYLLFFYAGWVGKSALETVKNVRAL